MGSIIPQTLGLRIIRILKLCRHQTKTTLMREELVESILLDLALVREINHKPMLNRNQLKSLLKDHRNLNLQEASTIKKSINLNSKRELIQI